MIKSIDGTVTEEEISFDCEPYVVYNGDYDGKRLWRSYTNAFGSESPEDAFRSLLKSKGIEPTKETKILILKEI